MWIWVVIIGGAIVAWSFYKSKTSSTAAATDTSTSASDVPQFVNQTYTTVTPPSVTVNEPPSDDIDHGPIKVFPPYQPKPPVKKPPPTGEPPIFNATYIVRKGDTLNSVAKRFGITRVELAHANGYGTGAGLRTGERLKVPEPKGVGTPNKAP